MNESITDGGPAFPAAIAVGPTDDVYRSDDHPEHAGMSLRDYFAAAALQGYSAVEDKRACPRERLDDVAKWGSEMRDIDAKWCYQMADAMLRARRPQ